ncbi:MAG TPA: TatD family hydrolase [Candidatus Limnocylindrales bacterium]|nr:TatD family hydrolase [Candidatus Limnocylindrales bacterium]
MTSRAPAVGLVDTHCHLTDPRFDDDRQEVISRALEAGLTHIVAVGGGGPIEASEAAAELARTNRLLRSTAGIHPHDASTYDDATEGRIEALLEQPQVVAVGETGLDYYYEHSPKMAQCEALSRHVALALRFDKPIVLHCRDAEADMRAVLTREAPGGVRGVVHCFTGTYEDARWYIDYGLVVSFSGILTFPKSASLRETASRLPLDRLMVETDSPYLAPVPHRGKRNEPAYVAHVAAMLASACGTSVERVIEATAVNAASLFALT